jgi:salicylate hydroxylase
VSHTRGVSVTADEENGRARSARAFAFVGADGVNSQTRVRILGGPTAEASNRVAWRALLDLNALDGAVALDRTSVLFAPGYHAVCYPLPHRGKLNIALFSKEKIRGGTTTKPPTRPTLPYAMLRSRAFDAIMEAGGDNGGYWPRGTVSADDWYEGSIGLIGDAAHAMLPFQAQGAAMAIEDAAILAPLLMTEPNGESAFERFVSLRRARVDRVSRISASNGFAFHLEWPFTLGRDTVLRLQGPRGHLRRLDWLYGYDAAPDVEIPAPPRGSTSPTGAEREHRS